jgi:MFS family permease
MITIENRNFRTFLIIWFGQCVSTLGSGLTNFGIGVWIFQQTHSTTSFALSALFTALPGVLASPFAGSLVDRWDRRVAMIVSAGGAGIASLILALLVLSGRLDLWEIYALMAVSSIFSTLTFPAISAITSTLVVDKHLGRANGLLQFNEAASMILTPALAAWIMATAHGRGLQWLVILDVVSFVVAIAALSLARTPALERKAQQVKTSLLAGALDGWRFIVARKGLLGLLLFFLVINFSLPLASVMFTPLVLTFFDVKALGWVESFSGIGMLAGTIVLGIWGGPKRRVYGVLGFGALGCSTMCLIGLPPSVTVFAISLGTMMAIFPVVNASSQAIWQRKVPIDMQGRAFAIRRMIAWCMSPLAFALAGPLADKVFEPAMMPGGALAGSLGQIFGTGPGAGIRVIFVAMGALSTIAALLWLAHPRIRNVETELPDAVNEPASSAPLEPSSSSPREAPSEGFGNQRLKHPARRRLARQLCLMHGDFRSRDLCHLQHRLLQRLHSAKRWKLPLQLRVRIGHELQHRGDLLEVDPPGRAHRLVLHKILLRRKIGLAQHGRLDGGRGRLNACVRANARLPDEA